MHHVRWYDTPDAALLGGIPAENLDAWLQKYRRIRLLKLDCEGAEYPFLATTKELGRVDEVAGELHLKMDMSPWDCTKESVASQLERNGFRVEWVSPPLFPDVNEWFFARRAA